jgi:hypothetical protein
MGNPKAREFFKQQEITAAWKQAETGVRELTEDLHIPGIGLRRIQLVHAPSFEIGYSWDLRVLDGDYRLFCSRIIEDDGRHKLSGYSELQVDVDAIKHFLERLGEIALPIAPDFSGNDGLDGTLRQLAFVGDLHSEVRFQWWSEYPAHWCVLVALADEMINSFLRLPPKRDRSTL